MVKIPPHAKKVFSGVLYDVYQWEQELYDGTTTTFEALRRPWTVEIIPVIGDKIAIERERQPGRDRYMTLISGRIEEGEYPLDGAKRELEEEAGIVASDWQLYTQFSVGSKVDHTIYYYIARNCQVHGKQNLDAWEQIEVQYVDFDGFISFVQSEKNISVHFANHIFRLEKEGRLGEFQKLLFG